MWNAESADDTFLDNAKLSKDEQLELERTATSVALTSPQRAPSEALTLTSHGSFEPISPQPSAPSAIEEEDEDDDLPDEDNCLVHDPWFHWFCTSKWFLLFVSLYALVQSMIINGIFPAVVSTVQHRYNQTSTTMGYLASVYEIAVLVFSGPIGYLGAQGHVPRWLGSGLFVLSIGALLFVVPWLVGDPYTVQLTFTKYACVSGTVTPDCSATSGSGIFWIFFIAVVLLGLGSSPLYSLTPPYLDKVVKKTSYPIHLGFFYAAASVGPAVGYLVAAFFLDRWVDESWSKMPDGIRPSNSEWVGDWWAGFGIAAGAAMYLMVGICLYPKYLPRTSYRRREHQLILETLKQTLARPAHAAEEDTWHAHVTTFIKHVFGLVKNPTYVFTVLGQSVQTFAVAGFALFLPRIAQSVYQLTASDASKGIGLLTVLAGAGGGLAGGIFFKKTKPTVRSMARSNWIITGIATLFMLGFLLSCNSTPLAGVSQPYPENVNSTLSRVNLTSTCNTENVCPGGCDIDKYAPVCGSDGLNYFSGCYAGCKVVTNFDAVTGNPYLFNAVYANCTCIPPAANSTALYGTATLGKCSLGCDDFKGFLAVLFFMAFFTFLVMSPTQAVVLRSTEPDLRSTAFGVENMVIRLLGTIPGPIIFGSIIDSACQLRATHCGGEELSSCLEYDTSALRYQLLLLGIIPSGLACLFYFIAWVFFQAPMYERAVEMPPFSKLDWDNSGAVSRREVLEWILDEQFIHNAIWNHHSLHEFINHVYKAVSPQDQGLPTQVSTRELRDDVFRRMDKDGNNEVNAQEFHDYINTIKPEMRHLIMRTLLDLTQRKRKDVLHEVFDALDADGDGKVSVREVRRWLYTESSWANYADEEKLNLHDIKEKIIEMMQEDKSSQFITFESLCRFFDQASWPLRYVRKFTQDARYLNVLKQYYRSPTPELKQRLDALEEERSVEVDRLRQSLGRKTHIHVGGNFSLLHDEEHPQPQQRRSVFRFLQRRAPGQSAPV